MQGGQRDPAVPVVLGQRVLDGHDRVVADQRGVERRHLGGGVVLALEAVHAVVVEFGRRDVERERDVLAGGEAGLPDRLDDDVQRRAAGVQRRGEAALVAQAGRVALLLQHGLQRVVDLRAPAQRLLEGVRADRGDHELLAVHPGVGVRAAVDDVHHRHRQDVRVRPADVAEQLQVGGLGGGLRHGQRDAEDRVRTEPALVPGCRRGRSASGRWRAARRPPCRSARGRSPRARR